MTEPDSPGLAKVPRQGVVRSAEDGGPPPIENDVTRYLCCAVQLDSALARRAVEEIVEEPRRAIASSPGIDLSCVLAYALDARTRQATRDLALAVLTVLLLFTFTAGLTMVILWLLIAWAVVSGELFFAHYRVIAPQLRRENFRPDAAPQPHVAWRQERLKAAARQDGGNLTVFQGYAPFAGYGTPVEAWSFALRSDELGEGAEAIVPFEVHELYAHVGAAVARLELPGVRVHDRLFVNGEDLRFGLDDSTRDAVLPNPGRAPATAAPAELIRELREDGTQRARPYLALQVTGWNGELVSTLFLRFALLPNRDVIFVEGSTSLLTPVRQEYRTVDTLLDQPTAEQYRAIVAYGLRRMPGLLLGSIPAVLAAAGGQFRRNRKERDQLRAIKHRSFNYGAPMSIREAAADHRYSRYFQRIDREMYTKVVERRVLDSLIEFLEAHGIDSSDLRDRQTAIYNNGIFVGSNSSLRISDSAMAIGRGAVGRLFRQTGGSGGGGAGEGGK